MTREAVVEPGAFGPRAAILEEGRLLLFLDPPTAGECVADRLFLGRVLRVEPRMNAAFLDLGTGSEGFLTGKDARFLAADARALPIGRLLREGQKVMVQGLREADEDKRARVTTDIRLFGLFLIHRPHAPVSEVSERARGRLREDLAERAQRLFPEGGFALRRHAAAVDDATLLAEAEALRARFRALGERARRRPTPGPLGEMEDPLHAILRLCLDEEVKAITVADAALAAALKRLMERLPARLRPELRRLPDGRDAFALTGVTAQLEEALAPVVPLAGGGRVVIEPTLACVAIDVDGVARTALEIDLEAAATIGRQVRLRNLGGNIIVDFIDLTRPGDRKRLEDALRRAFRDDPAQAQVHPMSPLGIVQISRARRGRPLAARYRRPCRCCGAPGREPSLEARIEELFQVLRFLPRPPQRLRAGSELVGRLRQLEPGWLHGIPLVSDPELAPDAWQLEGET